MSPAPAGASLRGQPPLEAIRIVPGAPAGPALRPAVLRSPGRGAPAPRFVQDPLADAAFSTDAQLFGPQPTSASDLPDPLAWVAHIAQALVEVMTGARSPAQVVRWTTPEVYEVVARRGALASRRAARGAVGTGPTRPARVRRVRVCEPVDGVAEASVVVIDGHRVRAVALRLVGEDGRWRVAALQVA